MANTFTMTGLFCQKCHAKPRTYRADRIVYHLASKPLYAALGHAKAASTRPVCAYPRFPLWGKETKPAVNPAPLEASTRKMI